MRTIKIFTALFCILLLTACDIVLTQKDEDVPKIKAQGIFGTWVWNTGIQKEMFAFASDGEGVWVGRNDGKFTFFNITYELNGNDLRAYYSRLEWLIAVYNGGNNFTDIGNHNITFNKAEESTIVGIWHDKVWRFAFFSDDRGIIQVSSEADGIEFTYKINGNNITTSHSLGGIPITLTYTAGSNTFTDNNGNVFVRQ